MRFLRAPQDAAETRTCVPEHGRPSFVAYCKRGSRGIACPLNARLTIRAAIGDQ